VAARKLLDDGVNLQLLLKLKKLYLTGKVPNDVASIVTYHSIFTEVDDHKNIKYPEHWKGRYSVP
jgi:hypothetical protein